MKEINDNEWSIVGTQEENLGDLLFEMNLGVESSI
jgi:hypothetical protein